MFDASADHFGTVEQCSMSVVASNRIVDSTRRLPGAWRCRIVLGLHACKAIALICLALGVAGCQSGPPADREGPMIRVAYTSAPDVGDLPSLIAHRLLQDAGYRIEETFYAQPELAVEALASGAADVASGGTRAFWAAALKGAQLRLVMEHSENGYQLAAHLRHRGMSRPARTHARSFQSGLSSDRTRAGVPSAMP